MKLGRINRSVHRDLGFLFFAMSIIYGLSGISLNHIDDINPNYIVENYVVTSDLTQELGMEKEDILAFLSSIGEDGEYKKHYFPKPNKMKIFIKGGSIVVNTQSGEAHVEKLKKRPVFYQFNFLHYNHAKKLYKWFADLFAGSLILLAITGLFMVKGKKGIFGRGAWLVLIGILIPFVLYLIYS